MNDVNKPEQSQRSDGPQNVRQPRHSCIDTLTNTRSLLPKLTRNCGRKLWRVGLSMSSKRFPRKAKKWAKREGVQLISVSGKRMWYAVTYRPFKIT